MGAYVRAHGVTLELPVDVQRGSEHRAAGLRSVLSGTVRRYARVLSDVSFGLEEGDRVALLGLNGAGKTTLLRVLNGAFPPTRGSVECRGAVQSLLNSTLGFSEYATVTENVVLRGTAMGLRHRQLQATMDDILAFSGLSDRAHHRLHTLSAGQRTRLGFAISTAVQPDILLMDEWIATGDATFMERAQQRLLSRFEGSRIVVLASHSTELQRRLCNKALVLDQGRLVRLGDIEAGLSAYRRIVSMASEELRAQATANDPLLFGSAMGMIERVRVLDGRLELEGWASDEEGREVATVCVEVGELRAQLLPERVDREDVRLYLAKKAGHYGFRVALPFSMGIDVPDLLRSLKVSAGAAPERLGAPLPVAKAAIVEVCLEAE